MLNAGTVNLNNAGTGATNSALGTGRLVINGGTLANLSGAPITLATNNAQTWSGNFTLSGSNTVTTRDLNFGTGAVTMTCDITINATGTMSTFTIGGVIGDGGGNFNLKKTTSGTGTLVLTGANTYGGGTNVAAGTLLINNTTGSGTGTGFVTAGNPAAPSSPHSAATARSTSAPTG